MMSPRHSAEISLLADNKSHMYEDISSETDTEAAMLDENRRSFFERIPDPSAKIVHWVLHAISLLTIISCFFYAWHMLKKSTEICALRHNAWSPALDLNNDHHETRRLMGTFLGLTPFKGPPNDEVNNAWGSLSDVNTVNLTAETMIKLGRSFDSLQYPTESGAGYMAQLAAIHQMHCLHVIWRDHHLSYFPIDLDIKAKRPGYYEAHYEHCIDMVRQRLMCTADPGLITFRWIEGKAGPEPDFNTQHQCRSFETLLDWNRRHEAIIPVDDIRWKKPADAVMLAAPP